MRFHGREAQTWEATGITPAERFRHLYDRDELAEWARASERQPPAPRTPTC